ncbi:hypothetical protein BJY00DRAFT_308990 [Aspergillus carlsbadensis]|nr:hypothetical protein BJY00DRAFT_308990 [Aspergillus carlsbadensis]
MRSFSRFPNRATESSASTISTTPDDYIGTTTTESQAGIDNSKADLAAAEEKPRTILKPTKHGPDPAVLHQQVDKVLYHYTYKDGTAGTVFRHVSKEVLGLDNYVTSQSLFRDDSTGAAQWLAARDEIGEALASGREPQRHLVNFDLRKEDRFLLAKLEAQTENAFRGTWRALPRNQKMEHWYRLSLWLLQHTPSLLPKFLLATTYKQLQQRPSFLMVAKCITHLNKFSPGIVDYQLITACLDPSTWPVIRVPQSPVRLYVNTTDREHVYYAWHIQRKKRTHMSPATLLCFMKRFTEFGDVDMALKALLAVQRLGHRDFSMSSKEVIHHCCTLLMRDTVVDDGNGRNFAILPRLIDLGVQPTQEMLNIVLSNALKGGDSQAGNAVLDYMKSNQLEPDQFTYLALLKDAVATEDRERLGNLLHDIQSRGDLHKNKWLSSKILHSHFVFTAKRINTDDDPQEVFYSMLGMYNQLHDITPLKDLSIIPPNYVPPAGSGTSEPSIVALYIMIATYLRCMQNLATTERVYLRYRSHVLRGHKAIAPLAATDHTYNEFLVAFRNYPQGMRPAVRLIEDMQHSATKKIVNSEVEHAPMSTLTWAILLSVFVFHKQSHAAERVLAMMDKHNVKYSMDTWNILLNYHANEQNHVGLAETIKRMESEGFTMDEHSMRSLRFLREPDRLWATIDELDKASDSFFESSSSKSENGQPAPSLLDQCLTRMKDNMSQK